MSGNSSVHNSVVPQNMAQKPSFDLKSWQGLTEVLKKGKDTLKPEAYAEFRNLVLQYAQHGGDIEYKKRIDAVIATFSETPPLNQDTEVQQVRVEEKNVSLEKDEQPPHHHTPQFIPRRMQPQFGAQEGDTFHEPIKEDTVSSSNSEKTDSGTQQKPPEPTTKPDETPAPLTVKTDIPERTQSIEDVELIKNGGGEKEGDADTAHTSSISITSQNDISSERNDSTSVSTEEYKKRISEIKHAVNEQFENPVALMAVPDGAGKAYMGALLGALKATGPGASGSIRDAMNRLEKAFETLLSSQIQKKELVVEEGSESVNAVAPVPERVEEIPEPIQTPEPEKEVEVPEPASEPDSREEKSEPEPVVDATEGEAHESHVELPIVTQDAQIFVDNTEERVVVQVDESVRDAEPRKISIPKSDTEEVLRKIAEEQEKAREQEDLSAMSKELPSADVPPMPPTRSDVMNEAFQKTDSAISSVVSSANKSNIPEQNEVPRVPYTRHAVSEGGPHDTDEGNTGFQREVVDFAPSKFSENKWTKKEISKENPVDVLQGEGFDTADLQVRQVELFSPKITTMLDTLLHEWNIFAGSGFFGVGPSGAEHPLYLTLAPLSMGEVIAGRWDGADPKIIKIIKQYVDAWRHEQGISYTSGETFEHYLRRVVQRIVKRQNL